jgi:hypothetical protein
LPIDTVIDPPLPLVAFPEDISIDPAVPVLAVPVTNSYTPLTPLKPAFAVAKCIEPLLAATDCPLWKYILPPDED